MIIRFLLSVFQCLGFSLLPLVYGRVASIDERTLKLERMLDGHTSSHVWLQNSFPPPQFLAGGILTSAGNLPGTETSLLPHSQTTSLWHNLKLLENPADEFLWFWKLMFASDLSLAVGNFCSHFYMIALQIFGNVSRTMLSLADFLFSRKMSLNDPFNSSPYSPPPITWVPCLLPSFSFPSEYFLVFKSPSSLFIMDHNISFRCGHWTFLNSVFFCSGLLVVVGLLCCN